MQPQINLYNYLPKKSKYELTPQIIVSSYGGFLLLLFLFYFISLWNRHELNVDLNKLTNEVAIEQQKLFALTKKYPESDAANLKKSIATLQKEFDNKTQLLDLLSPYSNFSSYLTALGNAIVPGVWLTEIMFDRGETKITLKGFALQTTLLEKFYSQLSSQKIFSDLTFKVNEIKQSSYPASFYITAKKANSA